MGGFGLHTRWQVLAETAGVHQHVGLEGGVKLVMSAAGEARGWWSTAGRGRGLCVPVDGDAFLQSGEKYKHCISVLTDTQYLIEPIHIKR